MEQLELKAATRETLGKKVRFLRRQGVIPVHLFGHDVESLSLQCEEADLRQIISHAGMTRLINVKIDKSRKHRSAVIRYVQKEPVTGNLLHVDLYQVNLTEKIKVQVPVKLTGEAPAMKSKGNMLLHDLNTLTIECLPDAIPSSIEVDLSILTQSEQSIQVKDLVIGKGITVLNDPEHTVVKISALLSAKGEEEKKETPAAETGEAAAEPAGEKGDKE